MKNANIFSIAAISLALTLTGCNLSPTNSSDTSDPDQPLTNDPMDEQTVKMMQDQGPDTSIESMDMSQDEMMIAKTLDYQYSGKLVDVTGGISSGAASSLFTDGTYKLLASFEDLPDPEGTDFYEGWVVKKNPMSVVSTGKVDKLDDVYTNIFAASTDLTDHDFYVLTLEPDDGDPAPAAHILEGTMTPQ